MCSAEPVNLSARDLALALAVVTVWGVNFVVIKIGIHGTPPLVLAALRFVLAAFPAVLFIRRPEVATRSVVLYGLTVGVGQFGCLFYGMSVGMPAGVASVVLQSQALFTLLFARLLLRESITRIQVTGLFVAVIGLLLVAWSPRGAVASSTVSAQAFGFTVAAAAFWGFSNILVRKASYEAVARGGRLDVLALVVWSSLVPPLPLLGLGILIDSFSAVVNSMDALSWTSVLAVLYLAYAATLFGFGAWSALLAKYPMVKVAPLSMLVPAVGLVSGAVLLDERLSPTQWIGCLIVIVGLLVVSGLGKQGEVHLTNKVRL